jgi:hypothetical protein
MCICISNQYEYQLSGYQTDTDYFLSLNRVWHTILPKINMFLAKKELVKNSEILAYPDTPTHSPCYTKLDLHRPGKHLKLKICLMNIRYTEGISNICHYIIIQKDLLESVTAVFNKFKHIFKQN